jgi:hypothetical protein
MSSCRSDSSPFPNGLSFRISVLKPLVTFLDLWITEKQRQQNRCAQP